MSVYRDPRNGQWRYRITVRLPGGARKRISGTPSLNTRVEAVKAERDAIEHALDVARFPERHRSFPVFAEWLEQFFTARAPLTHRPSTIGTWRTSARCHVLPVVGELPLDRIGIPELDRIVGRMRGAKAAGTINGALSVVSAALRYAVECGELDRVPPIPWQAIDREPADYFSMQEYEALLVAAKLSPVWVAAFRLGGDAGLRIGEVLALLWTDVTLDGPAPYLHVSKTQHPSGRVGPPKQGRDRHVPISGPLLDALDRLRRAGPHGPHVIEVVGKRYRGRPGRRSEEVLTSGLRRYLKRAGIAWVSWKGFRHTFASRLAAGGAAEVDRMALLGHTTPAITRIYTHTSAPQLARAIRRMEEGPDIAKTGVVRLDGRKRRA